MRVFPDPDDSEPETVARVRVLKNAVHCPYDLATARERASEQSRDAGRASERDDGDMERGN